jgi:serine protease
MPIRSTRKVFLFLLSISLIHFSETSFGQSAGHEAGDLIVMLHRGDDVQSLISDFTVFDNKKTDLIAVRKLSDRLNIWLLHFNASAVDENKFLPGIQQSKWVHLAQFNHYIQSRNSPNDADFGQQWNMLNIGQTGGTSGADVRATSAWDITTGGLTAGGDTIVIAIDDDGFDLAHEDLVFRKNHNEIPGNGIDDDNNGYIDDYDGWNAQNHSGTLSNTYHGTHVAGIAGAIGNNGIGVAGVNWNVQIMPVQGNSGVEAVAVEGYGYILEMRAKYNETDGQQGAFVVSVNSSWGVDFAMPSNFPIWCAMYDSMGHYGIVNAAATNNSSNVDVDAQGDMPTACPSDFLITVTNSNNNDQRVAAFGATTIDLAAPGNAVWSTLQGNTYGPKTGTSMSSPHVAGAVALLCSLPCQGLSDDLKNNPASTALLLKNFILSGVDTISSMEGFTVTGGRLNVYQALLNAATYYNCNVGIDEAVSASDLKVFPNPATDAVTITLKNVTTNNMRLLLYNELGQTVISRYGLSFLSPYKLDLSQQQKGIYYLEIRNDSGTVVSKKIMVM